MRIKVKITFNAIGRMVKRKFVRFIFIRNPENCVYLYHSTSKIPVIEKNTNIAIPMVKKILKNSNVSCSMAADIPGYIYFYFIKKFHSVYRTFKILCVDCHLSMIPQNFVDCKQKFKNKNIKLMKIEY